MRFFERELNDKEIVTLQRLNDDDSIQGGILFSDGTMLIDKHYQDCCEHVYADWSTVAEESGLSYVDFSNLTVEMVESGGIRIGNGVQKFFVPCYNCQNGYYSDCLDIVFIGADGNTIQEWLEVPVEDDQNEAAMPPLLDVIHLIFFLDLF